MPEENRVLKIANWNVERADPSQRRCSAIREHMAAIDADVWVLTETHELISPGDDYSATFSAEPDRQSLPGERWVGIWSKFAVQPRSSLVSDSARCVAARLIHPKHGDIVVYGCVLPWHGSKSRDTPSVGGAAFEAALDLHRGDWRRLRNAFPNAILIVAGDFNQDLAFRHYYGSKKNRRLLEKSLEEEGLEAVTAAGHDPVAKTRLRMLALTTSACRGPVHGVCFQQNAGRIQTRRTNASRIILASSWNSDGTNQTD